MRAYEFLNEHKGKMNKRYEQATQGVMASRDIDIFDRTYHLNRMGMAMACADGINTGPIIDMDEGSFAAGYNTIHPYTEAEYNMMIAASRTMPTDKHSIVPFSKSLEPEDTNKKSVLPAFKGYKK